MDYQDILEKNIQDTRKEFHEVVNMLSKIKGEYNDLFSRKNKVEIEIIRLNNEYLYKFTELSDIEVKIDEYKANNLQKISKIGYSYQDEVNAIKKVKIKADESLNRLNDKQKELNLLETKLIAKSEHIEQLTQEFNIKQDNLNKKEKDLIEKQHIIENEEKEIKKLRIETDDFYKKGKEYFDNKITEIKMRENLVTDRENLINDEKLRIADQWKTLKQTKAYLDNLKKNG